VPEVIANALDLLYIMAYKPRAHEALRQALEAMSEDEVDVFQASQQILREEQSVSMLFVDGLVGRNFAKGLSFYLTRYGAYLEEIGRMTDEARRRLAEDGVELPLPDGVPYREDNGITSSCRGSSR
jgi:hypothetical protein